MKTATLQIGDHLYGPVERTAAEEGRTVEEVAARWLAERSRKPRRRLTPAQRRAAMRKLLKFAGALNSGDPHSGDNERIDADLAREHADRQE